VNGRRVGSEGAFQDQIRKLGQLISQFDQFPEGPQKIACKELVQLLMDVHGAGFERMMEMVFEGGSEGPVIVDRLAKDSMVRSLLLLYSLHPDDVDTRVRKAIEQLRPRLRKLACSAELVSIDDGAVKLQVTTTGHNCGSSAKEVRTILEDGVYDLAPDVQAIEILGLEERSSSGFIALESLLGHGLALAGHSGLSQPTDGAN
jgi:hypothetical protein